MPILLLWIIVPILVIWIVYKLVKIFCVASVEVVEAKEEDKKFAQEEAVQPEASQPK